MKFKRRSQPKATTFALTSMLDVIFLLLWFMPARKNKEK